MKEVVIVKKVDTETTLHDVKIQKGDILETAGGNLVLIIGDLFDDGIRPLYLKEMQTGKAFYHKTVGGYQSSSSNRVVKVYKKGEYEMKVQLP